MWWCPVYRRRSSQKQPRLVFVEAVVYIPRYSLCQANIPISSLQQAHKSSPSYLTPCAFVPHPPSLSDVNVAIAVLVAGKDQTVNSANDSWNTISTASPPPGLHSPAADRYACVVPGKTEKARSCYCSLLWDGTYDEFTLCYFFASLYHGLDSVYIKWEAQSNVAVTFNTSVFLVHFQYTKGRISKLQHGVRMPVYMHTYSRYWCGGN